MKRIILVVAVTVVWAMGLGSVYCAEEFIWEDIGRGNLDLRTVLVHPQNPRLIYFGTGKGVFETTDGSGSWQRILSIPGKNKAVNFLTFGLTDNNLLYAATGNGLYCSQDGGKNWDRIFIGKDYLESACITVAVSTQEIYLGTRKGLFTSKDNGRSWQRSSEQLGKGEILALAANDKELYAVSDGGLWQSQDCGQSWARIFIANANRDEASEEEEEDQENKEAPKIRHIIIDPRDSNLLYLATSTGIYKSCDKGKSWDLLSSHGLLSRDSRFLLLSADSRLYVATKSGVFLYNNSGWQEISLRIVVQEFRSLFLDNQDNLYVATDKGLFKTNIKYPDNTREPTESALYDQDEPEIRDVQQAAIKYAEVEPEKIKNWRKQAARKAWLPELTVGVNRDTGDLWHWETGSTTRTDDDVLRRGRAVTEWDINLKWDLSELVFNSDQTSIDVRSRLTAQLRDDILDEVTKIYFERLRVKMELDNLNLVDRRKRFEKELRLKELTAMLDGLTGGYLSRNP